MKTTLLVLFSLMLVIPAAAATVEGILIDNMCSMMVQKKGFGAAKMHQKSCALMPDCQKSGFGVATEAGKYYKLDDAGNKQALAALKGTDKEDNLTVTVDGSISGDTIAVKSLKL